MREEFEKLPEIAERLYAGIYWNNYQGKYQTDSPTLLATVGYLNGAWYAYQEQQKKIDDAKEIIKHWHTWPCELKYGGNLMLDQLHKIEELLK